MSKNLEKITETIKILPKTFGVYKMIGENDEIIYIGKANNLKDRVSSYFLENEKTKRIQKMVENIFDIEFIEVSSELEAFFLETNLIKKFLPKYNILMKDGKNFCYLKINTYEDFPRLEIVRKFKKDGAKYFGPKFSKKSLEITIRVLQEIYPIVFNNIYLENGYPKKLDFKKKIEKLDGISKEVYQKGIEKVLDFFSGKLGEIKEKLQEKMMFFAKEKNFKMASKMRDMIFSIEKTMEKQIISGVDSKNADILGIYKGEKNIYLSLFQIREGKMIYNENFIFSGNGEEENIFEAIIFQYYSITEEIPKEIILSKNTKNEKVLEDFFEENFSKKIKIILPKKGKNKNLIEMAEKNAKSFGVQNEKNIGEEIEKRKKAFFQISEAIGIKSTFKRIEGYDISHFGGTGKVASMVVFKNGKPDKKEYKKFTIKSLKEGENDDFKSMEEVILRRLENLESSLKIKKVLSNFSYIKLLKKDLEKFGLFFPENKEGKNFTFYGAFLGEKFFGAILISKFDKKVFEVDFENSFLKEKKDEIKKDFLIGMNNIFYEKTFWIFDKKEGDYLETGFLKLKTLNGNLKNEKSLVPEQICDFSLNKNQKVGYFFSKTFGKKLFSGDLPNLFLIDGGKGQLSSVVSAFEQKGFSQKKGESIMEKEIDGKNIEIIVCALAKKKEEIFLIGEKKSCDLKNDSEGSFLFQRVRDESHRFALTFQKTKRRF